LMLRTGIRVVRGTTVVSPSGSSIARLVSATCTLTVALAWVRPRGTFWPATTMTPVAEARAGPGSAPRTGVAVGPAAGCVAAGRRRPAPAGWVVSAAARACWARGTAADGRPRCRSRPVARPVRPRRARRDRPGGWSRCGRRCVRPPRPCVPPGHRDRPATSLISAPAKTARTTSRRCSTTDKTTRVPPACRSRVDAA